MAFTAQDVYDGASALLNDVAQAVFTGAVQQPYLNIAIQDLKRKLELNNVPVTNDTSAVIAIPASTSSLSIGGSTPCLPSDLIELQRVFQRSGGTENPFLPIQKYEYLPHYWEGVQTSLIPAWAWYRQLVKFIPANIDLDIKIDYVADIIPAVDEDTDEIDVLNAIGYLQFQTAGHCALYIGSNESRANVLYSQAGDAFQDILGIGTKGRQSIYTRRRPFMAAYKTRGVSY